MSRVVVAALGSLGDLIPVLGVARALENLGAHVTVATNILHREFTRIAGFEFAALGDARDPVHVPPLPDCDATTAFLQHICFSQLDGLYEDLAAVAAGADALVAPYFVAPAHLVAERLGLPYFACALSPAYFISPATRSRLSLELPHKPVPQWHRQLADLRRRLGLRRVLLPYAATLESERALLGLFPAFLATAESLERPPIEVMGYPHTPLNTDVSRRTDPELMSFCDERTVLFSFGSFVDRHDPLHFLRESIAACRKLDLKCVYVSRFVDHPPPEAVDRSRVLLRPFVDHDAVLPHVGIMVNHGGLGSLCAAVRHSRAMITVPFAYDQPYHAARLHELAATPNIPAARFRREVLGDALEAVLADLIAMEGQIQSLAGRGMNGAERAARAVLSQLAPSAVLESGR